MTRLLGHILGVVFFPGRITGPIFTKELRVSSRRRRTYVLRLAYLAALILFVGLMWAMFLSDYYTNSNSTAGRVVAMSEAGKRIILCIVWFQFCAMQLIAVVMLSTSVSDEVLHRTLGVLLSTPITSRQVVLGKLLSKLLQILVLLAISLPLLAMVRVFGGVPWDFVLIGLCITLCAVVLAGSISLLLSITSRHAYAVIIETFVALICLYGLLPLLSFVFFERSLGQSLLELFLHCNPFMALAFATEEMLNPGRTGGSPVFSWPLCCGVLLGASAAVLTLATVVVRRATLRQATGQTGFFAGRKPPTDSQSTAAPALGRFRAAKAIRRIRGCPVLWKELRTPLIRRPLLRWLALAGALGILGLTYAACAYENCLDYREVHVFYGTAYLIVSAFCTAILAATPITAEREAGSWPLLLQTSLSDWQILRGKAAGVLRRCLPLWLPLPAHIAFFAAVGSIHPAALLQVLPTMLGSMLFLTAGGLYFSSRCRKTTNAVILNLGLAVLLWAAVPFVLLSLLEISHGDQSWFSPLNGNPLVQVIVVLEATGGGYDASQSLSELHYRWPEHSGYGYFGWPVNRNAFPGASLELITWMILYFLAAAAFFLLARRRLRKVIF